MLVGARRAPALGTPSAEGESEPNEDLALSLAAGRCVACGSCDRRFDAWADVARDQFTGPMAFVLRASTGPAAWPRLGPMVGALERGNLAALEADCPAHVPFVSLARVVRAKVPPPAPTRRKKARDQNDPG